MAILLCSPCCSRVPFRECSNVPVEHVDASLVTQSFSAALPDESHTISTILFRYGFSSFPALGYTSIDLEQETFTVVALNPVGIKLFELSGNAQDVTCSFALEEFSKWDGFAAAVSEDIRRIYFDRTPSDAAIPHKTKYRIVFAEQRGSGVMEYVFGGQHNLLIEKRFKENKRTVWTVSYYEYRKEEGELHPGGAILKHRGHRYQLTVRLLEICR